MRLLPPSSDLVMALPGAENRAGSFFPALALRECGTAYALGYMHNAGQDLPQ